MSGELRERVALLFRTMYATEADRRIAADAAIALIRPDTLEEAARVVTEHYQELCTEHRLLLVNRAAAIRALAAPSGAVKDKETQ